ncbi:MAG: hypothetical protein N0C81_03210 [Candidatus Thiodiazotropha lotti]|nr:hypothetical protein [Candidatus Thiodiazotropha lotti]MCG8004626.1 hypothetical protein [Candidatus Thiodiazotropha lotti]MCG8006643.1 hypothetical protein [Candidatus Thiodiazotropha lotti]MCW4188253.1 hypothetical protein [Candidatus Thiodiazotropha lotti]MCW4194225.1 hypothetical protein [Candidatus Thiodiazotropha lotti]
MKCKLCGNEGKLLNSHIIPVFIYRPIYDEINRFHVISSQDNERNKYLQKGIREKLLCDDCERLLSKNERYVSLVFSGAIPIHISGHSKLIRVEDLDYTKFKLFALSILWRAGVSKHETFEYVNLGMHEKILREMVLENDPGSPEQYPFLLSPIVLDQELLNGLIVQPTVSRIAGHYAYRFVFAGLAWVFIVSKHRIPNVLQEAALNKEGGLSMVPRTLSQLKFITELAQELKNKGKL